MRLKKFLGVLFRMRNNLSKVSSFQAIFVISPSKSLSIVYDLVSVDGDYPTKKSREQSSVASERRGFRRQSGLFY